MARRTVPTGAGRQALFDELSAVFARCGERADAIKSDRDTAVANIPAAGALVAKRDLAVRDAERRAASAAEKADRAIADTVQAADRDYYDTAQAVDARRQQAGIDADAARDASITDAKALFEDTIRSIHNAVAGLQAIADAEKRARDERDKSIREADSEFRKVIQRADVERQRALDAALTRQAAAHAAADSARSQALTDAQMTLADATGAADRSLEDSLAAIPDAKRILDEAAQRLERLEKSCDEQKRAIEAKLRGEEV